MENEIEENTVKNLQKYQENVLIQKVIVEEQKLVEIEMKENITKQKEKHMKQI